MYGSNRVDGGTLDDDVYIRTFAADGTPLSNEVRVNPSNDLVDDPDEMVALARRQFRRRLEPGPPDGQRHSTATSWCSSSPPTARCRARRSPSIRRRPTPAMSARPRSSANSAWLFQPRLPVRDRRLRQHRCRRLFPQPRRLIARPCRAGFRRCRPGFGDRRHRLDLRHRRDRQRRRARYPQRWQWRLRRRHLDARPHRRRQRRRRLRLRSGRGILHGERQPLQSGGQTFATFTASAAPSPSNSPAAAPLRPASWSTRCSSTSPISTRIRLTRRASTSTTSSTTASAVRPAPADPAIDIETSTVTIFPRGVDQPGVVHSTGGEMLFGRRRRRLCRTSVAAA